MEEKIFSNLKRAYLKLPISLATKVKGQIADECEITGETFRAWYTFGASKIKKPFQEIIYRHFAQILTEWQPGTDREHLAKQEYKELLEKLFE